MNGNTPYLVSTLGKADALIRLMQVRLRALPDADRQALAAEIEAAGCGDADSVCLDLHRVWEISFALVITTERLLQALPVVSDRAAATKLNTVAVAVARELNRARGRA